jgi:hypothetical protein
MYINVLSDVNILANIEIFYDIYNSIVIIVNVMFLTFHKYITYIPLGAFSVADPSKINFFLF